MIVCFVWIIGANWVFPAELAFLIYHKSKLHLCIPNCGIVKIMKKKGEGVS